MWELVGKDRMEKAIAVEHLTKIYRLYRKPGDQLREILFPFGQARHRDFYALNDLSFSVERGESVGIIGKNGSGKSTLLKLLTGVTAPTGGSLKTAGRVAALLELGAGFNPEYSGIENIYLNGAIQGMSRPEIDAKLDRILEFAGIGAFAEQPVKIYSSGMFIRLAFALSIHVEPDILIIDEAFSVGDIRFQQKCFRKIEELREAGVTILLVSHDMSAVLNYCDRAVWLMDGRIYEDGTPRDVCKKYASYMHYDALPEEKREPDRQEAAEPEDYAVKDAGPSIEWEDVRAFDSFGEGGARIERLTLCESVGRHTLKMLNGGERVVFLMEVRALQDIGSPLVGFLVRDEYGNNVTGMNNDHYRIPLKPFKKDTRFLVEFEFVFPTVKNGTYTFSAAVADGSKNDHIQHHWVHDAYVVQVANPDEAYNSGCYFILDDPEIAVIPE